jgi:hypothetical protein
MRLIILLGLLALLLPIRAMEVSGVRVPPAAEVGGQPLELRGAGLLRWKLLVRIYVAAFYLPASVTAAQVLDEQPKRIAFHYQRGFSAEDLVAATNATITRGMDEATRTALQPHLDAFNALYPAVQEGDVMDIDYVPGVGTSLSLNGIQRGTVADPAFARALFAIWLGDKAVDDGLKRALLAR